MKRFTFSIALFFFSCLMVWGDEQTRLIQQTLKDQGFYYGEVDGNPGSEVTGAIRRYQIRNGLEVTGTLDDETRKALNISGEEAKTDSPVPMVEEEDRKFLEQQKPVEPPSNVRIVPPPVRRTYTLDELFAGTPYSSAPVEVQENTLRRAQVFLARNGFYRGDADGVAGPATEKALLNFQRENLLSETGRLDLETLNRMNLLPQRDSQTYPQPQRGRRVIRGIWIH